MSMVICGAGQVGYGIAEKLSLEAIEVTVIDTLRSWCSVVRDNLDARGIHGHGSHPDVLAQAGARDADMLIAVTQVDEVNMMACQVAHSIFEVPTRIARIRAQAYLQPEWSNLFTREHLPIDVIISPEVEVGEMVLDACSCPAPPRSSASRTRRSPCIGIECDEDCPIIDTPLGQLTELFPNLKATVVGVCATAGLFVPHSEDQ